MLAGDGREARKFGGTTNAIERLPPVIFAGVQCLTCNVTGHIGHWFHSVVVATPGRLAAEQQNLSRPVARTCRLQQGFYC